MPSATKEENTTLQMEEGESTEELSEGLFAVFGLDKSFNSNIYLYDNEGILRSEYVLENYRSDRILFLEEETLYSYCKDGFIKVNSLGKITAFYSIEGYEQHHDFIYDEKTNQLLVLANEIGTTTIEDVVIALDLDTNTTRKIIDMKKLLPEVYSLAVSPVDGNTYGGDELDWIHLNSLSLLDDQLLVSSRELSTIIKIDNIYTNPTIDYAIAEPTIYDEDIATQDLLLNKSEDFISQAGQHSVQYVEDDSLDEGQYYITMYNNNYTASRTRQDIDYSAIEGAGT